RGAIDAWSGRSLSAEEAARARTIRELKALAASPAVASAGPNYRLAASAVPNDPFYPLQWHYPAIQLPAAWDITRGERAGSPVVVAVVDTGVLTSHPDLAGQLVAGFDFVSDAARALDGDGIDADATDPGDRDFGGASSWHGTHVAGTIAAATDNGSGVAGVAGGARVMPIRVLGRGGGTAFDILQGVRYAAGLDNVSSQTPDQPADIINLSLGGPAFVPQMQDAITQARAAGVIVVAAAGNEASSQTSFPAGYDGVISVSAVDIGNARSDFSNFGATIDVAAPGGSGSAGDVNADGYPDNILSTHADDTGGDGQPAFGFLNGTSMAAPHVAGVLALMRAVNADITPAQVDTLLAAGQLTDDLGIAGRDDEFGHGLINAYKAVVAARDLAGGGALPPVLAAQPGRFDFGSGSAARTLRLENQGGGVLDISAVTASDDWIVVSGGNTVNGALEFQVSVDRRDLPGGAYGGRLTITSNVGSHIVPVTMLVAGAELPSDVGRVYFLLLDPETGLSVAQADAAASSGRYDFRFNGVEAGEYLLVAGSDLDNDDFICGPGESCGAWPVASAPDVLTVGADGIGGLSMSIGSGGALRGSALTAAAQRGYPLLSKPAGGAAR
ncbi:MAG: S8 family serine peptidase, partial [Rhodocyclaceae bacterium]|nr:S8 family serine peptidase [Rhodocyclaceae bacterium]